MTPKQTEYVATMPEKSRKLIERAFDGTTSPRQIIKAKCLACCNFDRAEAAACSVQLCPLYALNPYRANAQEGDEEPDSAQAIAHNTGAQP